MKRLIMAAMLLGGIAVPASAAEVVWQGDMYFITVSAACKTKGFNVGSYYRSEFKPRNLGDNGPDTKFSLVTQRSAVAYHWTGADFGNGAIPGNGIGSTANAFSFTSTFTGSGTLPAAANITPTTRSITVTAKIANFFNTTGCNVTLKGNLGQRLDLTD
jgi:hypothetical protein